MFEHFISGQHLYEHMVMPVCRRYDLTYMEFTVLMFLAKYPQYDTAAQIVKMRRLTKSHVSISLRTLQDRGLVQSTYLPGNRKTLHLRLTAMALPVVEEGRNAQRAFAARLIRGFTPEEVAQLHNIMEKLQENMKWEEETDGK